MPKSKAKARAEAEEVEAKANPKAKAKAKAAEAKAAEAKAEPQPKSKGESRFAVIQAQGLQLRVAQDEEHILPHLGKEPGEEIRIDRVLLVSDGDGVQVGRPLVEGAVVVMQVVGHEKGEKVKVGTYKRRKKYRRKIGYRDTLTRVKILGIDLPKGEKREKHGA
ncbi:MAG TPA: 50S ribosomal protein L21 [Candidatus Eisenbacteria bacterium]|nr:50S ribosomal protein L21 [Candidatus Eisenbacteria bacterium]